MNQAEVGDMMPDVELQAPDGTTLRPSDFRGRPLVLFFYPRDDTPGCTTEAIEFSALMPHFEEAGIAVLGISKDSPESHRKFVAKHNLSAPLASDPEEQGLADALGIWIEKTMYGRRYMGMERTTFLVDAEGRIARIWRKVRVTSHAAEVLTMARPLTGG